MKVCTCLHYHGYEPECLTCGGTYAGRVVRRGPLPVVVAKATPRWVWSWGLLWRDLGRYVVLDACVRARVVAPNYHPQNDQAWNQLIQRAREVHEGPAGPLVYTGGWRAPR